MSRYAISRRQFLTLSLALVAAPLALARAEPRLRKGAFRAEISILYGLLSFDLKGTVEEAIDRAAGQYAIKAEGRGASIAARIESSGVLRGGRWAPLRTAYWFQVAGREWRSEIAYDYARRTVGYHYRGETFFLQRLRVADDLLPLPAAHLDDAFSIILNYADGLWPQHPDGSFRTRVVRRRRPDGEGPDDVEGTYRAEVAPLVLRPAADHEMGRPTAFFDLSRFSSWAREGRPARIVFGPGRRPEKITASLALGTSVSIRLASAA